MSDENCTTLAGAAQDLLDEGCEICDEGDEACLADGSNDDTCCDEITQADINELSAMCGGSSDENSCLEIMLAFSAATEAWGADMTNATLCTAMVTSAQDMLDAGCEMCESGDEACLDDGSNDDTCCDEITQEDIDTMSALCGG